MEVRILSEADELIADYPYPGELLMGSIAKADMESELVSASIISAILEKDDTEAGRLLRKIVYSQAGEWI